MQRLRGHDRVTVVSSSPLWLEADCRSRSYVGSVEGVHSVSVTLLTERAMVTYDASRVRVADIVAAVEDVGFTAVEEDKTTATLRIGGMTCAACVGTVEGVLRNTQGVTAASVNLLTGKAKVEFVKDQVCPPCALICVFLLVAGCVA